MENKRFYFILTVFTAFIFILNINHLNQQLIFTNMFLDAAGNILSGNGYTNTVFSGDPAYYPMWGYSLLLLPDSAFGTGGFLALFFQLLMAITGVYYFYRLFAIKPGYIHLLFHLPFIGIMSVKWPDAVIAFLFILFFYFMKLYYTENRTKSIIISGIFLGIMINFRTEFLYLPVFYFALLVVPGRYLNRRSVLKAGIVLAAASILFISPWAIRSYIQKDEISLTTSNNGMVSFISLGALADNPWKIYISDITAWNYVKDRGEPNPFSEKGNSMLEEAFYSSVKAEPVSFLVKCAYNFGRCFTGGVYTGEFANIAVGTAARYRINEELKLKGNALNQLTGLAEYGAAVAVPVAIEKIIQAVYIPLNLAVMLSVVFLAFRLSRLNQKALFIIILVFIIYKLVVTSLFIYEPRFWNSVYYLAFGIVLIEKNNIPLIKKIKFIQ